MLHPYKNKINFTSSLTFEIFFVCSTVLSRSINNMGTLRSFDINCHHRGKIIKFGSARNVRRSTNSIGYEPQEIYKEFERNTGVSNISEA